MLELNESAGIKMTGETTEPKDLNKIFNTSDLVIISKYGMPGPQNWRGSTKEDLEDALDTGQINGRSRKQNPTTHDRKEIAELKKEKGILYKHKNNLLTAIYSSSHTGSGFQKRSQDIIDRIKKLGGEITGGNMN